MSEWFRQLAFREKLVLAVGSALAVLIIGWQFVWLPLTGSVADLRESVGERSRFVVDLRRAADAVPAVAPASAAGTAQSPMLIVEETARAAGIASALPQTRMVDADTIRITVRDAAFASLVDWLARLERQHGLRATSVTLNGTGQPGLVAGQIELNRS